MKLKLILPTLTMAVPALLPMVSCDPGRNDPDLPEGKLVWELGDGPYTSKINPAREETVNTEKANAGYFHDVANNLNIMADDFMSSEYGDVPGRKDVTYCSFECSVADTEQQLMNVKMDVKIMDGEDGENKFSIEFKNFKFLLTFVNNKPVVTPDWKYVDVDADWLCIASIDGQEYSVDKSSSDDEKDEVRAQIFYWCRFESHYFKNKTITPAQPAKITIDYEREPLSQVAVSVKDLGDSKYCIHTAYEATIEIQTQEPVYATQVNMSLRVDNVEIEPSWDKWQQMKFYPISDNRKVLDVTILDQSFLQSAQTIEFWFTLSQ